MDDTNFDAMEWDQKENAQIEPEQSPRKSQEGDKKESEIIEKRVSLTVDQAQNEAKEKADVPITDQEESKKEVENTEVEKTDKVDETMEQ